jgi:membrane associated rhomboid family serine protease
MVLFAVVICLFSPILPVPFSGHISGAVTTFTLFLFFFSLQLSEPRPRLSLASISDRMPGSESL